MADFFHMGGYGFFVWSSYAIVAVTFTYAFLSPILRHRQLRSELADSIVASPSSGSTVTSDHD